MISGPSFAIDSRDIRDVHDAVQDIVTELLADLRDGYTPDAKRIRDKIVRLWTVMDELEKQFPVETSPVPKTKPAKGEPDEL